MHPPASRPENELVLELARLVDDDALSSRLETAYGRMTKVLALTIPERETIIRALDERRRGSRSFARVAPRARRPGAGRARLAAEPGMLTLRASCDQVLGRYLAKGELSLQASTSAR